MANSFSTRKDVLSYVSGLCLDIEPVLEIERALKHHIPSLKVTNFTGYDVSKYEITSKFQWEWDNHLSSSGNVYQNGKYIFPINVTDTMYDAKFMDACINRIYNELTIKKLEIVERITEIFTGGS